MYAQQEAMLYPADPGAQPPDLRQWPGWQALADGGEPLAYWREPAGAVRGTVVLFHGNGGVAMDRSFYFDALAPLGYRLVLVEYAGYGGRQGRPSEERLVSDGRRVIALVAEHFGGKLYVWGESLGAGVAAATLAKGNRQVRGLVMLTPWNTLADAAGSHFPYLPVRWLLRDQYDSVANLKHFPGRVAVIVAGADRVIPPELAYRLYAGLAAEKRLWHFVGAGHNDWPAGPAEPWWGEVMGYLGQ